MTFSSKKLKKELKEAMGYFIRPNNEKFNQFSIIGRSFFMILLDQIQNQYITYITELLNELKDIKDDFYEFIKQDNVVDISRQNELNELYNNDDINHDQPIQLIFNENDLKNMDKLSDKFWSWYVLRSLNNGFDINDNNYLEAIMMCKDNNIYLKSICAWDKAIINCDGNQPRFVVHVIEPKIFKKGWSIREGWSSSMKTKQALSLDYWFLYNEPVLYSLLSNDPWEIMEIDFCFEHSAFDKKQKKLQIIKLQ